MSDAEVEVPESEKLSLIPPPSPAFVVGIKEKPSSPIPSASVTSDLGEKKLESEEKEGMDVALLSMTTPQTGLRFASGSPRSLATPHPRGPEEYMLRDDATGLWQPAALQHRSDVSTVVKVAGEAQTVSKPAAEKFHGLVKRVDFSWKAVDGQTYEMIGCDELEDFGSIGRVIANVSPVHVDADRMDTELDLEMVRQVDASFAVRELKLEEETDHDLKFDGLVEDGVALDMDIDLKEIPAETPGKEKACRMTTEEALNIVMMNEDLGEGSSNGTDDLADADNFDECRFSAAVEEIMSPGSIVSEDIGDLKLDLEVQETPRAISDRISRSSSPELEGGSADNAAAPPSSNAPRDSVEDVIDNLPVVVVDNPDGEPLVGPRCSETGWTILKMDEAGKRMGTVTYKYVSIDGKVFTSRKEANRHSRDNGLRCPPPARVFFAKYEAAAQKLAGSAAAKALKERRRSESASFVDHRNVKIKAKTITKKRKSASLDNAALSAIDDDKPSYEELELGLRNAAKTIKRLRLAMKEMKNGGDLEESSTTTVEDSFYSQFMPIAKVLRKVKQMGYAEGMQAALD